MSVPRLTIFVIGFSATVLQSGANITDLNVIIGEHSTCTEGYSKVAPKDSLNGDLNQGSGGEYIWLCVKQGSDDAITDLAVVASGDSDDGCGDLDDSWSRISQSQGSNGDLNQGAGGKYIYLCYKKEQDKTPLDDLSLKESDCDDGMFRASTDEDSNGDLNQGAGGKYIYLCARRSAAGCTAQMVKGYWVQHGTIAAPVTETWKYGTTKSHSESKTEKWSESVSATVQQGWSLYGADGSISITGSYAHETSISYSSAWTINTEQDYQITWGEDNVGKTSWQFQFEPTDSCQHVENTLVK